MPRPRGQGPRRRPRRSHRGHVRARRCPARGHRRRSSRAKRSRHQRKRAPVRATGALAKIEGWSGWPDLNRRPPAPQAGALPGCATSRMTVTLSKGADSLTSRHSLPYPRFGRDPEIGQERRHDDPATRPRRKQGTKLTRTLILPLRAAPGKRSSVYFDASRADCCSG